MTYINFIEKLDSNKFKNVNLINVAEPYLGEKALELLKTDFIGGDFLDFNFEKFDFENFDFDAFVNAVETLPFMGDRRLVIIDKLVLDRDKLKKYEDILGRLGEKIGDIGPTTYIFMFSYCDKLFKGKFVKAIEKKGDLFNFSRLDRNQLANFIAKYFKQNGRLIDSKSTMLIVDRTQYLDKNSKINLLDLENELDKLMNNISSKSPTIDEIEEAIIENYDEKIFTLLDLITSGNVRSGLMQLHRMAEDDEFMIFYMIVRQIRNLICLKSIELNKIGKETGVKYCSISPYEFDKLNRYIDRFSMEKLLGLHRLCFDIEVGIKTSQIDIKKALERLVLEFR